MIKLPFFFVAVLAGGLAIAGYAQSGREAAPVGGHTPSFTERFDTFDHAVDQTRPDRPHRWRTVYGAGGALSKDNRQLSGASFASDAQFGGIGKQGLLAKPLGLDPFRHRPGELAILADRVAEPQRPLVWNKPYYGGAITTKFSFSQRFGYFEAEAVLASGKGMWPAFWLMPETGTWPEAGELDIMESLGDPHVIYCTVISGKGRQVQKKVSLPFDGSAGFHRYGVLWGPQQIVWYVDRREVARAPTPEVLKKTPMYMILNLAVGGSWGGYPDATTRFPGRFVIRRVTAWRLGDQPFG